jgi:hypothetical protein
VKHLRSILRAVPRDRAGEINRRTSPAAELAIGAAEMSTAADGCQPGDFCRELAIVRAL